LVNRTLRGTGAGGDGLAENIDFSGKFAGPGRSGRFSEPNPDEDAADLRDPELLRLNRFSNDDPHSDT
jgi:hypothetical protein